MKDPNIIYGGDFEERWSYLNSPSLGAFIIEKLREGGTEKAFVNSFISKDHNILFA